MQPKPINGLLTDGGLVFKWCPQLALYSTTELIYIPLANGASLLNYFLITGKNTCVMSSYLLT